MMRKAMIAIGLAMTALPAASPAVAAAPARATAARPPAQLSASQRENYRAIFAAIRASDWAGAAARLDAMAAGPLHAITRAELYLAKGSPTVTAEALVALLASAPDLPQAAQITRLARARGAETLPELPVARDLVRLAGASRRGAARSIRSDVAAARLAPTLLPLIRGDRPSEAEALLDAAADLSPEARTEWRQRIAWSYYLAGDDLSAGRLATLALGGIGEWRAQAAWVAGLAAWRMKDCNAAATAFSQVASLGGDAETRAAGLFWAARAEMACARPQRVQPYLRTAARMPETFYGLLAAAQLGLPMPAPAREPGFIMADWNSIAQRANAGIAVALTEIGETALADQVLRHQARIGPAPDHEALLHLAARLDLPATQIWLARNGPAGITPGVAFRYPQPGWTPQGGWRVDKALVFAHALQESQFRSDAVSSAGARGLMQLMPGTAQLIAKRRGETVNMARLNDPALNIEYGQSYLQELADYSGTAGLLPKVIAAYNAGPGSVANWNARGRDRGDPLLFIESIPFAETRAYVAIVLRNYWMYRRQGGISCDSLKAMAQGLWPRFPGLPGKTAMRLDTLGRPAAVE